MVNWDMAKWRKMREEIDGEIAYAGLTAMHRLDLGEEKRLYLDGYRAALNYMKTKYEEINEEYERYKKGDGIKESKPKTVDFKIGLTDDDIKECFIKAMEETLKELKKEVDKDGDKC